MYKFSLKKHLKEMYKNAYLRIFEKNFLLIYFSFNKPSVV